MEQMVFVLGYYELITYQLIYIIKQLVIFELVQSHIRHYTMEIFPGTGTSHQQSSYTNRSNATGSSAGYPYHCAISKQIDMHNNVRIGTLQKIKVNNSLIRLYTDSVYEKYHINNPFASKSNIDSSRAMHSSAKSLSNRKFVKINKKRINENPPGDSDIINQIDCAPPKLNKLRNKNILAGCNKITQQQQENTLTPTKLGSTLKKMNALRSTARTHLRSKTGMTVLSSVNYNQDANIKSSPYLQISEFDASNINNCQSQFRVQVSQFEQKSVQNINASPVAPKPNIKIQDVQKNIQYANKLMRSASMFNRCHNLSYCPICEQKIDKQMILQHEGECQILKKLYTFQNAQLVKFITWKMNEHLHQLNCIITDPELKIFDSLNQSCNSELQLQSNSMQQTMERCWEQVQKCMWFRSVKENMENKLIGNN